MIPRRIKLSGFLSYKSEQDLRFHQSPLWILCGQNGSGKSSVFDGVTYALYGSHRGGSQSAAELINKESNQFSVDFDFEIDGQLYRIKRTLKRNRSGSATGTQQIYQCTSSPQDLEPTWEALPDTNKKTQFDTWITEKIGLDYETFTSSVLLLQGKAEKLLDSKPGGRAEILASIVNLEKYKILYEKANSQKLAMKAKLEQVSHQAEAVPEVTDEAFAAVVQKIEQAEQARGEQQQAINDLQAREREAQRWQDTETRLQGARDKLQLAESLLKDAVKIEKDHARLQELEDVLPCVNAIVVTKTKISSSEQATTRYQKEQVEWRERKAAAEGVLEKAKNQKETLRRTQAQEEKQLGEVSVALRELTTNLQLFKQANDQELEHARLEKELAGLPADAEKREAAANAEVERLTELSRVLPILERFQKEQEGLIETRKRKLLEDKAAERVKQEGESARKKYDVCKAALDAAVQAKSEADQAVAAAEAIAKQAQSQLDVFSSLRGEKNCQACGQPLTKAHFEEERQKRTAAQAEAAKNFQAAIANQKKCTADHEKAVDTESKARVSLEKLRSDYKDALAKAKESATAAEHHVRYCHEAHTDLPEVYRNSIAKSPPEDWARVDFAKAIDPTALGDQAAGLDAARRKLKDAEAIHEQRKRVVTKRDMAKESLTKAKATLPPGDLDSVRALHQKRDAEEKSLKDSLRATRKNLDETERDLERHSAELHRSTQSLIELAGKIQNEESIRGHCRETIEREVRKLPEAWRPLVDKAMMAEYQKWKDEQNKLIENDTEKRFRSLEQARLGLDTLRTDITMLQEEVDKFPVEVRVSPQLLQDQWNEARKQYELIDVQLQEVRSQKAQLEGFRDQRAKLGEQFKELDTRFHRYKMLSELLGKDRLQRYLSRKAERQIVDYANIVLDRLSTGMLFLKLVHLDDGQGTERAFDLECYNRVTGGAPINVTFLSGSQRFRVAVSLALGIGQYASRQHRPIESVIIDEGFACLDRAGRQVMIQELQNLREQLRCILLVSHQEEFSDAFRDGYRFELRNGATEVARFQR